jgi:hypothetical protein
LYTTIFVILISVAAYLFISGLTKQKKGAIVSGVIIGLLTGFLFWLMNFWGEMLWFQSVGFEKRFWTEMIVKIVFAAAGAFIGWFFVFTLTISIPKQKNIHLQSRGIPVL